MVAWSLTVQETSAQPCVLSFVAVGVGMTMEAATAAWYMATMQSEWQRAEIDVSCTTQSGGLLRATNT